MIKKQVCEKLEAEIKLLKSEIEKVNKGSQFENSSRFLNVILSSQRSRNNTTSFGYTQDSTSSSQGSIKKPITYADALKNSFRKEDSEAKMTPLKNVTHKQKSTVSIGLKYDQKKFIKRNASKYLFGSIPCSPK